MTRFSIFSFLLLITCFCSSPLLAVHPEKDTSVQPTQDQQEAKQFIIDLGHQAIALLTSKTITENERKKRFIALFKNYFSIQSIAKFCLGRYWRQATDAEKKEYLTLFDSSVADNYASKFNQYNEEDQFIVSSVRPLNDGGMKVNSHLETIENGTIKIGWLIYKVDNSYKIFDVLLEGVSMSVSQRSEYASIIERSGGKISSLLDALKKRQL